MTTNKRIRTSIDPRAALVAALASIALASGCSVAGAGAKREEAHAPAHELFQLCQQCHGANALGNRAANAPSIAGLPVWYIEGQLKKFKAGGRGTHFDDLTGMQMRPMAMSLHGDAEIKTIAEYVSQLPAAKPKPLLSGGDAARGQTLFAPCVACHQPNLSGNEALNAPPLTHMNDWYLVSSLKKFKDGIRGSNPLDVSGATMRPMAQTLVDDKAIHDVVAYIVTQQK